MMMNLDRASKLIDEYGLLLENSNKYIINPISSLPSSKKDIKEAIKTIILLSLVVPNGRGFESLEPIKVSYASLANFIDDKDAKVFHEFVDAIESNDVNSMTLENAQKTAGLVKKVTKLLEKSNADFTNLLHELDDWLKKTGIANCT